MGDGEGMVEAAERPVSKAAGKRSGPVYQYRIVEDVGGWWTVAWRYASGPSHWDTVARVFGERRAEIVRCALSAEANERV